MNRNTKLKAATMLTIFVLLLGGLGLLAALPAAAQPKTVQGLVTKETEPFTLLNGVTVTLVDPHGQKAPLVTATGSDGKYVFSPSAGFYYVTVSKDGYFDNQTTTFRFDGTKNLIRDIEMEEMPAAVSDLIVHVEDAGGSPVVGASVEVFDPAHDQVLANATTNATGNATFSVWDDTFEVRVEKDGFNKSVSQVVVSGDTPTTVTLYPGIKLVGLARDTEGGFIEEGLVAYLYNLDGPTPEAKRLLTANVAGSSYTFYAYPGNFTVIVDANGTAANVTGPLFVHAGMTPGEKRIDRDLGASPDERVQTTFHYVAGDWNTLTVWRNLTLNEDSTLPGLPFAFVRDLRLQIDLALGDGDGVLQSGEVDALRDWLLDGGPKHVDTQGLFTTSSKAYRSVLVNGTTDFNVTVDLPLAEGVATVATWANHSVIGAAIPAKQDRYLVNITAGHDTNDTVRVNRTYIVEIVAGYERVSEEVTGDVELRHYVRVEVDPLVAAGSFDVRMVVEPSVNGTARPLVIGPAGRFTELNVTAENYTVIVPTEVNVTFSAEESTDPNSPDGRVNPDSNFTWTFTNDSKAVTLTVWGITPDVNFTEMGNYTGDLTIVETGGNMTSANFTVLVDGLLPVAIIENNVTGLGTNANGTEISVDEGALVRFLGGNSTDEVHEVLRGTIRDYRWDLDGDGLMDATGKDVEWTFDDPGNFTVNLTVVDEAGHESVNATMWVVVADVDPPDVSFVILTEDFEEALNIVEGTRYVFDGSATTDNFDVLDNLTFEWDFGDGETASGVNVTHVYEDFGTLTVTLNVTDQAGNEGNATREIVVEVDAPSRPDLRIEANSLRIDPRSPQESTFFGAVFATIRLNVSNKEDRATAENVTVRFWAFPFGGEEGPPIAIQPQFFDEDGNPRATSDLAPGEKMTIEFRWQTPSQGNYTVRVNVTDEREPPIFQSPGENSVQAQVDVRQAGWKTPLTIAAIVGIIAGIPVAIFLRRRYGARIRERITKR